MAFAVPMSVVLEVVIERMPAALENGAKIER
jgi:hypothetical protein